MNVTTLSTPTGTEQTQARSGSKACYSVLGQPVTGNAAKGQVMIVQTKDETTKQIIN
jgi:hypothetical protein